MYILDLTEELRICKNQNKSLLEDKKLHQEELQRLEEFLQRKQEQILREEELEREAEKKAKKRMEEKEQLAAEMRERGIKRIRNRWKRQGDADLAQDRKKSIFKNKLRSMTL